MTGNSTPRLHLTEALIWAQIRQVAPLVTRLTGWELGLDSLACRLLPKDQGYEALMLARLEGLGVPGWSDWMPAFVERVLEYLVEQNTLAAYLPAAGEIVVIQENVDDSNLDGLKLVLAHELVHRGQHLAHGDLFVRVEQLLRQALVQIQSGQPDLGQIRQLMGEIQPVMTLLESHAAYIQGHLQQFQFPQARIESHFNLGTVLMRLVGAGKVAQYTDGLPQVAGAYAAGKVDALYTGLG